MQEVSHRWSLFLGGHDLEMVEIGQLLAGRSDVEVHDHRLAWGAKASAYRNEMCAALKRGRSVAIIELPDDLPADIPRDRIIWIDHHGALAGADRPTSLEQIFELLEFPAEQWTRDRMLIAANDRGHIRGLKDAGATEAEIRDIRARDRAAQGISPLEEEQGREAASRAESHCGGRLLVIRLPHTRTATVTDIMPDTENLVVFGPGQTVFFGSGHCIEALRRAYPEGWFGGELPARGYWGIGRAIEQAAILPIVEDAIL